MTEPRRLTAEMRQEIQRKLDGEYPSDVPDRLKPALVDLHNALHDLDVADARIEALESGIANELEDIRLDGQALREKNHELCAKLAAQAQVAALRDALDLYYLQGHLSGCKWSPLSDIPSNCTCGHIAARVVLCDTAAAATTYTAEVSAQARREALEQLCATLLGEEDQGARSLTPEGVAHWLRALAAQPEKEAP